METPVRPTCETCLYWHKGYETDRFGDCRFDAPRVGGNQFHPMTEPRYWCGRHSRFPEYLEAAQRQAKMTAGAWTPEAEV